MAVGQITSKLLAQTRRTATGTATSYTAPSGTTTTIRTITIVNNDTSEAHNIRIYHDDDGTTYDATTAIYRDSDQPVESTTPLWGLEITVASGGSIGVEVSTGTPDVTFSFYGDEET